tara:strand:+ start:330 stop:503 length:174 start_codon:yes stop_codon:yes gene_type:complete
MEIDKRIKVERWEPIERTHITVEIISSTDNEGNIVYDFEGMVKELENELNLLKKIIN